MTSELYYHQSKRLARVLERILNLDSRPYKSYYTWEYNLSDSTELHITYRAGILKRFSIYSNHEHHLIIATNSIKELVTFINSRIKTKELV